MMNYQRLYYEDYQLMLPNGDCRKISRRECFAPPEAPTTDNPYKQRWYYSPDRCIAIRLPRNATGDELGRANAADLKSEERHEERKRQCVGATGGKCPITCCHCPLTDSCTSKHKTGNGKACPTKCGACSVSVSRTVELDKPYSNSETLDRESRFDVADEVADIARICEDMESLGELVAAYKRLETSDQTLFRLMGARAKKQVIADRLGLTLDGVNYRAKRLRKILRSDPALKDNLQNH